MINASELRINNYVGCKKSNDAGIYQVSGIDGWERVFKTPKDKELYNKPMEWQIKNLGGRQINWNDERLVRISGGARTDERLKESQLKPIKLTEEWLIRFDFIKVENTYVSNIATAFVFTKMTIDNFGDNLLVERKNGVVLRYVHQLQNLYFTLVKEELTAGGKLAMNGKPNGYRPAKRLTEEQKNNLPPIIINKKL